MSLQPLYLFYLSSPECFETSITILGQWHFATINMGIDDLMIGAYVRFLKLAIFELLQFLTISYCHILKCH